MFVRAIRKGPGDNFVTTRRNSMDSPENIFQLNLTRKIRRENQSVKLTWSESEVRECGRWRWS